MPDARACLHRKSCQVECKNVFFCAVHFCNDKSGENQNLVIVFTSTLNIKKYVFFLIESLQL